MRVFRPSLVGEYDGYTQPLTDRQKNLRKANTVVSDRDRKGIERARKALLETGIIDAERLAKKAGTSQYNVMRATFGMGMKYEYCTGCERMVHKPCIACNARRHVEQGGKVDLKEGEVDLDQDDPEMTEEAIEARKLAVRNGLFRKAV